MTLYEIRKLNSVEGELRPEERLGTTTNFQQFTFNVGVEVKLHVFLISALHEGE